MADQTKTLKLCQDMLEQVAEAIEGYVDVHDSSDGRPSPNWAMSLTQDIDNLLPFVRAAIAQDRLDHDGAIAELRAELEQQRVRAETAEFELHAERLAHAETQGLMIKIADQRDRAIAVGQGFAKLTGADHG